MVERESIRKQNTAEEVPAVNFRLSLADAVLALRRLGEVVDQNIADTGMLFDGVSLLAATLEKLEGGFSALENGKVLRAEHSFIFAKHQFEHATLLLNRGDEKLPTNRILEDANGEFENFWTKIFLGHHDDARVFLKKACDIIVANEVALNTDANWEQFRS